MTEPLGQGDRSESLTASARWKRAHPDRVREYNRRSNANRPERWYRPCPCCGEPMGWGSTQCADCRAQDQAERRARAESMWKAGATCREVCDALGVNPVKASSYVRRLRELGWDLPQRWRHQERS